MIRSMAPLVVSLLLSAQVFAAGQQNQQIQQQSQQRQEQETNGFDRKTIEGVTIVKPLNLNDIKIDVREVINVYEGRIDLNDQNGYRRLSIRALENSTYIIYYNSQGISIHSIFVPGNILGRELITTSKLIKDKCPGEAIVDIKSLTLKHFQVVCPADVAIAPYQENAG